VSIELTISILSAAVAVLSTGISVWFARRSEGLGRTSVMTPISIGFANGQTRQSQFLCDSFVNAVILRPRLAFRID
jgi:hypothetical protein